MHFVGTWFAISYQVQGSHAGCKGDSCAIDKYKTAAPLVEHRRMAWDDRWNVHLPRVARVCWALLYKHKKSTKYTFGTLTKAYCDVTYENIIYYFSALGYI